MTLDVLQDRIGYRFKDESLLVLAVTHSSWANEHSAGNAHNERLELSLIHISEPTRLR